MQLKTPNRFKLIGATEHLCIECDSDNSLQRDLVSSLNAELLKAGMDAKIRVRASDEELDDTRIGVSAAHQKARSIGQQFDAQLVVWGRDHDRAVCIDNQYGLEPLKSV